MSGVQASEDFQSLFRLKANEIQLLIQSHTSPTSSTDSGISESECLSPNKIRQDLRNLELQVIDASLYLPPYDQKRYMQEIKEMTDNLTSKQAQLKPKTKFQFKRSNNVSNKTEQAESVKTVNSDNLSNASMPNSSTGNKKTDCTMIRGKTECTYRLEQADGTNSTAALDVSIEDCKGSVIDLLSNTAISISTIHVARLDRCIVMAKPILGSIMISDCTNCIFLVGCHQFRMHSSKSIVNFLQISSHPIIEDCQSIQFAPLPARLYEGYVVMEERSDNQFSAVDDFNWLKKSQSPNWQLLSTQKQTQMPAASEILSATFNREAVLSSII